MAHDFPHFGDFSQPDGHAGPTRQTVLTLVEARLTGTFGEPTGRAAVTFVGADRIEVLRFGPDPDGLVRYATLGMAAAPMADPTAPVADPVRGPRAELVLTVRGGRDEAHRALAVLAASPQVEGLVVAPGGSLDLGSPLWTGAPFTSVLAAEPGGLVEDLELPAPADPVRFLPLLPMTPNEAAFKRVQGAEALQDRWLKHGTDLRDPNRRGVPLD
ncbi:suppressor of fused protein SUFU [Kitasatospora sp. SolWspMP-SS2h]|uniref:suppressor of fused domain protein n=1 Tax=Kitasatospora sp. SolWspMP-SS2h TaxID=1305729 RepID=UPI000DBF810F|nr:suppressor of fused domain protein [Kitasatospora sp. SolWspMP-SS2h]RAJ41288.1 suppressor of fused protein SUFU [Kitasatospora sp. SolWspMP-SS2h]